MPLPFDEIAANSLTDPLVTKGTAYTAAERRLLALEGLLPPRVETLSEQAARIVSNVRTKPDPLERYCYLSALQSENETLFYRVVLDRLEEMLPIVYTPTVGQACLEWSRIYERPRGLYISAAQHRGRVAELLRHWPHPAGIIVATDGGRILGLGDLGANGMGISIGKLALYTACAGVPPEQCLPIVLDVGTNNEALLADPFYLGDRTGRLTGESYDGFLEEFVEAVETVFPNAVLQFEDFNNECAFRLLNRYRDRMCCFNDDVQGTGAMGLAGLLTAGRITGRRLTEQRILFVGAGEACLGIGGLVTAAMRRDGLSEPEAKARALFIDSKGPVVTSRGDLSEQKRRFAQERAPEPTLVGAIEDFKPTVLIGACGQGGRFTTSVIEAMSRLNERPVILALSNPTSKSECTAEHAYTWSSGHAVFASGSPFDPVEVDGHLQVSGQANNAFVFPGVGFGLWLCRARRVSDEMFFAAAQALASQVSNDDLEQGRIFPAGRRMREVALAVSVAVADVAHRQGLAATPRPDNLAEAAERVRYLPAY